MTPQDITIIRQHHIYSAPSATINLSHNGNDIGIQMSQFCDKLRKLAPHIKIKNDNDVIFTEPVMVVGQHKNIAYYDLPTNKMLPLFLDALGTTADENKKYAVEIKEQLERLELPAALKLYVTGTCPHCPRLLRRIQSLALATQFIRLEIINAEMLPERAQADQIRSVPTLVLNDQFRWTGQVDVEELLTMCADQDPGQLSAESLRQLIESGEAARVAAMMVEREHVFPALIELLTHQRWSVRLGAMVTVEYLSDEVTDLGISVCKLLWDRFPKLTSQVQVDVIHLFSLVAFDATSSYLHRIAAGRCDEDKEVQSAAKEVLEERGNQSSVASSSDAISNKS